MATRRAAPSRLSDRLKLCVLRAVAGLCLWALLLRCLGNAIAHDTSDGGCALKLGIMQPYWFPYIGYFQLVKLVDQFVILDDAQWIASGWINRNRYLVQGKPRYFTLPVRRGSYLTKINEKVFAPDVARHKEHILRQIKYNYAKAPFFNQVLPLVTACLSNDESNVAAFVLNSLQRCCQFLNITTPFIRSSEIDSGSDLKGQDRVLSIVKRLGSDHYINSIGGTELYGRARFEELGVRLSFLRAEKMSYPQFANEFVPDLSIIDVMMFNSPNEIKTLLDTFELC